jgi:Na+/phosphate symporter
MQWFINHLFGGLASIWAGLGTILLGLWMIVTGLWYIILSILPIIGLAVLVFVIIKLSKTYTLK